MAMQIKEPQKLTCPIGIAKATYKSKRTPPELRSKMVINDLYRETANLFGSPLPACSIT